MNKAWDTVVTAVVAFIVAAIISFLVGYFGLPRGFVVIGEPIKLQSKLLVPVDIGNYQDEALNGLLFVVPASTNAGEIATSPGARIEQTKVAPAADGTIRLEISSIEPHRVTRLFIPIDDRVSASLVQIINPDERNVEAHAGDKPLSPYRTLIQDAFVSGLIYALIIGVTTFYTLGKRQQLRHELTEGRQEIRHLQTNMEQLKAWNTDEHKKLHNFIGKSAVLLQARLYDYAKELGFWRDSIRAILRSGSVDPDEVLRVVTKSLKTYQASPEADEFTFETINAAANLLRDSKPPETTS
jgi:hypothetical protein